MEFKRKSIRKTELTVCPKCAIPVSIQAVKCPQCTSDIPKHTHGPEELHLPEKVTAESYPIRQDERELFQEKVAKTSL